MRPPRRDAPGLRDRPAPPGPSAPARSSVVIQASFSALKAPASSAGSRRSPWLVMLEHLPAMANPIYEALPTTIFTVMSGLAREHRRDQPRPGLPGRAGARADPPPRGRGGARAATTSIRRCPACRSCARRWRGTTRAARASTSTGASEVTVTSGATEALAACFLGADHARRRGGAVPAVLRQLPADGPPRRRRPEARAPGAAATGASTARRWRRRSPSARGWWC